MAGFSSWAPCAHGLSRRAAAWAVLALLAGCRAQGPPERVDLLAAPRPLDVLRAAQVIDLGADDPATHRALLDGWSRREVGWSTTFAWVDATEATFAFFSADGGDTRLRWRAMPRFDTTPPQTVRVAVDDTPVAELPMGPGWQEAEIALPAAAVRRGRNLVRLRFRDLSPGSPGDDRRLAAAFDVIAIAPAGGAAPAAATAVDEDAPARLAGGEALHGWFGAGAGATLELAAACAPDGGPAAAAVWIGAGDGAEPEPVFAGELCGGGRGGTARIALPDGSGAARELFVVNPSATAALVLPRLALERPARARAPAAPPNVLAMLLDAQRPDHLGAYGYARPTSPMLDRLAAQGVVFTQAFAQAPVTIMSMPSLLTGTYPTVHNVDERRTLAPDVPTIAERLAARGYDTAVVSANPFVSERFGVTRGFATELPLWRDAGAHGRGVDDVVRAEPVADAAVAWLAAGRPRPFFLFLHFMQPHEPYAPPAPFWGRFGGADNGFDGRLDSLTATAQRGRAAEEAMRGAVIDRYDENVRYVDDAVGRLLRRLDLLGEFDDLVVVVTADHGEHMLDHAAFGHPFEQLYDVSLRVPLIIRAPGVAPRRVDAMVRSIDVGATLLELAGAGTALGQGQSLVPLMRGRGAGPPAETFAFTRRTMEGPSFDTAAVRTDAFKLIEFPGDRPPLLFDVRADPLERHDRAGADPATVAALRARIADLRRAHVDHAARPTQAPVTLDSETKERLRALGYLRDGSD